MAPSQTLRNSLRPSVQRRYSRACSRNNFRAGGVKSSAHECSAAPWANPGVRGACEYVPAPSSHSNTHRATSARTPSTRAAERTARPIHIYSGSTFAEMGGSIDLSLNRPNRSLTTSPNLHPRHPRLGAGICMASPGSWNSFIIRPNPPPQNARSALSLTSYLNNGVRHLCMTSNTVPNDCCHQGKGVGTVPIPF